MNGRRKRCENLDLEEMALITEVIESLAFGLRVKDPELVGRIYSQSAKLRGLITRFDGYLKGMHPKGLNPRKRSTKSIRDGSVINPLPRVPSPVTQFYPED